MANQAILNTSNKMPTTNRKCINKTLEKKTKQNHRIRTVSKIRARNPRLRGYLGSKHVSYSAFRTSNALQRKYRSAKSSTCSKFRSHRAKLGYPSYSHCHATAGLIRSFLIDRETLNGPGIHLI